VLVGGPNDDDTLRARYLEIKVGVVGVCHELGVAGTSEDGVVGPVNPTTSKVRVSFLKFKGVPKQTGRSIRPTGSYKVLDG
jgi:hypothetical protein